LHWAVRKTIDLLFKMIHRNLASNTIINLSGQIIPLLVAIVAIPRIVSRLGTDRFGVLSLAWMVIGYFSLFDLGFGRALTQIVSEALAKKSEDELPGLVWTALIAMFVMGIIGAISAFILAPQLIDNILKIPYQLKHETLYVFYLLACSMPVVILSSGLVGILAAYQRFDLINAIKIPLLLANFIMPVLVIPFTNNLIPMTLLLVIARLLLTLMQLHLCLRIIPVMRCKITFLADKIKPLFEFGGWMTITNIVGPLMTYFDRFIIGAVVSITAVAYYATPYEMISKLSIIPGALVMTLYPIFASVYSKDANRAMRLLFRGMQYSFMALFFIVFFAVCFSKEILSIWLGTEFADRSSVVLQWLAAGVFINGIAQLPYALLQGAGRPDITAKIHFCELILYLPFLWWMLSHYGIVGASVAWTMRVFIDCALLIFMVGKIFPGYNALLLKYLSVTAISCIAFLIFAQFQSPIIRLLIFFAALLFSLSIVYYIFRNRLMKQDGFKGIFQKIRIFLTQT
jgi:O-antigen/teichoic acid export membrane protein